VITDSAGAIVDIDNVIGTTGTTKRYDKVLGSLAILDMVYDTGNLVTVRYTGDDDATVYYRDVMSYTGANLTEVKHYYGTSNLVTESASTILTYDGSGNLITATYGE
jgi:hypothetical protein